MRFLTAFRVCGFLATFCGVYGQLEIEDLLNAQRRLNGGGGGGSGSGIGRMIGNSIRSSFVNTALTQAVKFIVGQSAKPSPELLQYGTFIRSAPRNQEERNIYLEFMKNIARRTPEVLMKYLKTEPQKNGTQTQSVDLIAMDADLTRRSLLYQQMRSVRRRERQSARELEQQHQLEIAKLNTLQDIRMNRAYDLGITNSNLFGGFGQTTSMFGDFGAATTAPPFFNSVPATNSNGGNALTANEQTQGVKQPTADQSAISPGSGSQSSLNVLNVGETSVQNSGTPLSYF